MAAGADPIEAGDVVRFSDLPGNTGGGEFKLTDVNNAAEWIITFCLQKTEYMNFTSNFIVGSINTYTLTDPNDKGGVNGEDPISSQTAWLYTQFTNQTLSKYRLQQRGQRRVREPPGFGERSAATPSGASRKKKRWTRATTTSSWRSTNTPGNFGTRRRGEC